MTDVDLNHVTLPLVWGEIFGRSAPTEVEIGAGKGKFLIEYARDNPDRNVLAVERSAKYHRLCCERIARSSLANVRLIHTTGEDLLFRLLRPRSVDRFFVLFPDPWPKKRHHKRRLFRPEIVDALRDALVADGRLLVKSDHGGYAEVIDATLTAAPGWRVLDATEEFARLPVTGFEHKYLVEGRNIQAWAFAKDANC